ncbi:MAG: AEC family transporter [Clostridia bacterium]|nr:AEC family transporter [Clostridia bacterium]
MNMSALISIVACLFLLMAVGYTARKVGIIDDALSKGLSRLIIKIGQVFLIINSFIKQPYSKEALREGLIIAAIGFALHFFVAVYAYFSCRYIRDLDERKLSEFSLIFTNCGFIGIPILESLMGPTGPFWIAFYFLSFHTLTWTWGILILARERKDIRPKVKNIIFNFGTVPCAIGLSLYLLRIPIPTPVLTCSEYLASLCTPISMLITGALLATLPAKKLFCSGKLYLFCFQKLLVIPLLVCFVMNLCGVPSDYTLFATIITALPAAAVVSMFGELYNIKPSFAALNVGMSSLLSVATLPAVVWIAEKILG